MTAIDTTAAGTESLPLGANTSSRLITFRAVLIGTAFSGLVAGLSPYNDFVVGNGFLIGCYLPIAFFFCLFVLTVCINAPLRRFLPKSALSGSELATISVMMLAACGVPGQGLLRPLLPTLVHPFYHGRSDAAFWKVFTSLGLPPWLFPVEEISTGRSSTVMSWFYARVPEGQPIPYRAWLKPLAMWGTFFVAMFSALVSSAMLVYPQWARNERLAFPIAQVELALISEPQRGRWLNLLLRSRLFWLATAGVFCVDSLTALHTYFPRHVPQIPLSYNFAPLLTREPWIYLLPSVKSNTVIFLFVGTAYFIQARIGFSIWGTFAAMQIVRLIQQTRFQYELLPEALYDQHFGASAMFMLGVFWVGRNHWKKVLAEGLGKSFLPLLFLVLGLAGMMVWLKVMGVALPMAIMIVAFILLAHLVTARVVAETGLPIFRSFVTPSQIYTRMSPSHFTGRDVYFAQVFTSNGAYTTRESALPFVQHGLWVFDAVVTGPAGAKARRQLGWLIAWAMGVSFVVGCWSSLHNYYTYAVPLSDHLPQRPINYHGVEVLPRTTIVAPLVQYGRGKFNVPAHNPKVHIAIGAAVAGCLSFLALRYAGWPFLPVGYVVATTNFVDWFWYSVMIGWLAKVLILRFGGAKMFQTAKPVFIGLIAGEVLAAAVWLVVNLILASTGHDYQPIVFYPS